MKTFIFCGGYGTRLNQGKPGPLKPILKIQDKTILQHIFKIYSKYGYKDFYLLGGYKIAELVKFSKKIKEYKLTVIDTGLGTTTAGRLKFIKKTLSQNENFFLTYGDSLANFNPKKALKHKKKNNFIVSSFKYNTPYGVLKTGRNGNVNKIYEKNFTLNINAGFYVLDHDIFKFIKSNKDSFEQDVLPRILNNGKKIKPIELKRWQPIDNFYDIECLEKIIKKKKNYFNV